jgi:hypothetical protein
VCEEVAMEMKLSLSYVLVGMSVVAWGNADFTAHFKRQTILLGIQLERYAGKKPIAFAEELP